MDYMSLPQEELLRTIKSADEATLSEISFQFPDSDGGYSYAGWEILNAIDSRYAALRPPVRTSAAVGLPCHYCGMPATSFNFFDVPVCEECNG